MVRTLWLAIIISSALGLAVGCSKSSPNLTSPSAVRPGAADAAADGSTLKVTAPTPESPVNNQTIATGNEVTLVVRNASASFGGPVALTYRFEIYNVSGVRVYSSSAIAGGSAGTTSHLLPDSAPLEGDQRYDWRARAEFEGQTGPWSNSASFIAPTDDADISAGMSSTIRSSTARPSAPPMGRSRSFPAWVSSSNRS